MTNAHGCWDKPHEFEGWNSVDPVVVTVMLLVEWPKSLDSQLPLLPIELWFAILEFVPRCLLGPHHV